MSLNLVTSLLLPNMVSINIGQRLALAETDSQIYETVDIKAFCVSQFFDADKIYNLIWRYHTMVCCIYEETFPLSGPSVLQKTPQSNCNEADEEMNDNACPIVLCIH